MSRKFIDIAVNLTDPMYRGLYHGMRKHDADLPQVLARAWGMGMQKMIVTGGSLDDSRQAVEMAAADERLYATVGCHPTRCQEFEAAGEASGYLQSLGDVALAAGGKVVAVGECGLDYDRLQFCPRDVQRKYFEMQLELCEQLRLPLFLHCRNAAADLVDILSRNRDCLRGGVVHSFDGSKTDAAAILDLGFYIGINGCMARRGVCNSSLKTAENLKVAASVPSERLMLETDSPWCEIRSTHASHQFVKTTFPAAKKEKWQAGSLVRGRSEPCQIVQVLEALAGARGDDVDSLCEEVYANTLKLFF